MEALHLTEAWDPIGRTADLDKWLCRHLVADCTAAAVLAQRKVCQSGWPILDEVVHLKLTGYCCTTTYIINMYNSICINMTVV